MIAVPIPPSLCFLPGETQNINDPRVVSYLRKLEPVIEKDSGRIAVVFIKNQPEHIQRSPRLLDFELTKSEIEKAWIEIPSSWALVCDVETGEDSVKLTGVKRKPVARYDIVRLKETITATLTAPDAVPRNLYGFLTSAVKSLKKLELASAEECERLHDTLVSADVSNAHVLQVMNRLASLLITNSDLKLKFFLLYKTVSRIMILTKEIKKIAAEKEVDLSDSATPVPEAAPASGPTFDIDDFQGLPEARDIVLRQLTRFERMPAGQEAANALDWLEFVFGLPLGVSTDAIDTVESVKTIMDETHYGLESVKREIMEHWNLSQHNPDADQDIICFDGPPGTGKTKLAESIANALGRPFVKISMGGISDPSFLRGDRRLYLGAQPGRIVRALQETQSSNPVIMFDEIDKVSGNGNKGDPREVLLDVFDPKQNKRFVDQYLGFPVDISKCLFICTTNDLNRLSQPIKDRLNIFKFKTYSYADRLVIAREYIMKAVSKNYRYELKLSDEVFEELAKCESLRDIERMIKKIHRHFLYEDRIYSAPPSEEIPYESVKQFIRTSAGRKPVGIR